MKKLILVLLVFIFSVSVANAQVAHVGTTHNVDHSGATTVLIPAGAGTITPSVGELWIVSVCLIEPGAGHPAVSSVTLDAGAQTFTQRIFREQNDNGDSSAYIFSLPNLSASAHQVTVTKTAAARVSAFITRVSGAATSSENDGTGATGTTAVTGTAPVVSGAIGGSPSGSSFFIGLMCSESANDTSATPTASTGFTIRDTVITGATDIYGSVETNANPGSGSQTPGFTAATTGLWTALGYAFKVAGAAGGASSKNMLMGIGK